MGNAAGSAEQPASPAALSPKQPAAPKQPMPAAGELEERFNRVLNCMNLPPDKVQLLSQYDNEKKWELICDQERFQVKNPPAAYIQKLRSYLETGGVSRKVAADWMSNLGFKRRVQESTQVLRELEISLRTNHIGWVQEFLNEENRGLDVLLEYLAFAQCSVTYDIESTDNGAPGSEKSKPLEQSVEDLSKGPPSALPPQPKSRHLTIKCPPSPRLTPAHSRKALRNSRIVSQKDDVHVCIMCLRAIMNYQSGFSLVMNHPACVNEIALSLNNKNPRLPPSSQAHTTRAVGRPLFSGENSLLSALTASNVAWSMLHFGLLVFEEARVADEIGGLLMLGHESLSLIGMRIDSVSGKLYSTYLEEVTEGACSLGSQLGPYWLCPCSPQIVLAFGNYMNSSKRGAAYGFRLQSLDALLEMKSTDRKQTLLHYLVKVIAEKYPQLTGFHSDLHFLDKAGSVSLDSVLGDVRSLQRGLELTQREFVRQDDCVVLKEFLRANSPTMDKLLADSKTAQEAYESVVEYFGENPKTTSPSMFFTLFSRFIKAYKKAEQEVEQWKKETAAQEAGADTLGRGEPPAPKSPPKIRRQQMDLISELKRKQQKEPLIYESDRDGAIEDIITDLRNQPYIRADTGRRSARRRPPGPPLQVTSDISL
nr:formin-like protein 1 [Equus asinus]